MTKDLFSDQSQAPVDVMPGMVLLPRFIDPGSLLSPLKAVIAQAPLRQMSTIRGHTMSVATTNCGALGWVSDRRGYRYSSIDPESDQAWPAMPAAFAQLSSRAARFAEFTGFTPDACLINRYHAGDRMGAHQDKDEKDRRQPIVSVSLGLPARFFVQGATRGGKSVPIDLQSGDVIVFGGPARLHYHGVRPLKTGTDEMFGEQRFNLTFRYTGLSHS